MKKNINIFTLLTPIEKVQTIQANCSLRQGLEKMRAHDYQTIPVLKSDGTYAGSVTEGDFLWFTLDHDDIKNLEECEKYRVSQIIKPNFYPAMNVQVGFEELVDRAKHQNYVPLIDDRNYLIGIVTRPDIVKALDE